MLGFYYYLISCLDGLGTLVGVLFTIMVAILALPLLFRGTIHWEDGLEDHTIVKLNIAIKRSIITSIILSFLLVVLPTKKDALIIGGLIYGEDVITETGEEFKKLPPQLMKPINKEISELTEETKEESK